MPEPSPFGQMPEEKKSLEEVGKGVEIAAAPEAAAVVPEVPPESEAARQGQIDQLRAEITGQPVEAPPTVEAMKLIEVPRAATFTEFAKLLSPERTSEIKWALTENYWGGLGDDAVKLINGEQLPNLNPNFPGIDPTITAVLEFFVQSGIDQADLEQTLGLTFI